MEASLKLREVLERVTTSELWMGLAQRLGIKFGKIQMAIHDGKPSKYATVDMKVSTEDQAGTKKTR